MMKATISPAEHITNCRFLQSCGILTDELHWQLHQGQHLGWSAPHSLERHIRYCEDVDAFRAQNCNATYAIVIAALAAHIRTAYAQAECEPAS